MSNLNLKTPHSKSLDQELRQAIIWSLYKVNILTNV